MAGVAFDPFEQFLDTAQSVDSGAGERNFVSCRCGFGNALLQLSVVHLVRVQFRRVAGQIEDLNLLLILLQPLRDCLGSGARAGYPGSGRPSSAAHAQAAI